VPLELLEVEAKHGPFGSSLERQGKCAELAAASVEHLLEVSWSASLEIDKLHSGIAHTWHAAAVLVVEPVSASLELQPRIVTRELSYVGVVPKQVAK
jgi:hypothetical protein